MEATIKSLLAVLVGYVLGSIPFAYLIVKVFKGIDIREHGSGNVGARNVIRLVGFWAGVFDFLLDAGKGILAVMIAGGLNTSPPLPALAGFAAIMGHNWSLFLGFQGGRGLSTAIGVMAFLFPLPVGILALLIGLFVLITRDMILPLAALSPFLPLLVWFFYRSLPLVITCSIFVIFIEIMGVPLIRQHYYEWRRRLSLTHQPEDDLG